MFKGMNEPNSLWAKQREERERWTGGVEACGEETGISRKNVDFVLKTNSFLRAEHLF